MDTLLVGLNSFSVPRDEEYNFALAFDQFLGRSEFDVETSHEFLELGFSFLAIEKQKQYGCENYEGS